MKKQLVFLLLIMSVLLVSVSNPQQTGVKHILPVESVRQETKMWCWAASAQMIMGYMGKQVTQCEQANHSKNRTDCCDQPTPQRCVRGGGWPEFYRYGFSSDSIEAALSWEALKNELDNNRPVAFSWQWKLGGGHMMVAVGYAEPNWVYSNNSWPPGAETSSDEGDYQIITYEEYVSGDNHVHLRDYFNIKKRKEPEPNQITSASGQTARPTAENPPTRIEIPADEVTTTQESKNVASGAATFVAYDKRPEPIGGFEAIQRALKYPSEAQQNQWKGKAVINVFVDKTGRVVKTEILQSSGNSSLDQAAVNAITTTKWRPALQRDKPVDVWVAIPINFKVR